MALPLEGTSVCLPCGINRGQTSSRLRTIHVCGATRPRVRASYSFPATATSSLCAAFAFTHANVQQTDNILCAHFLSTPGRTHISSYTPAASAPPSSAATAAELPATAVCVCVIRGRETFCPATKWRLSASLRVGCCRCCYCCCCWLPVC